MTYSLAYLAGVGARVLDLNLTDIPIVGYSDDYADAVSGFNSEPPEQLYEGLTIAEIIEDRNRLQDSVDRYAGRVDDALIAAQRLVGVIEIMGDA